MAQKTLDDIDHTQKSLYLKGPAGHTTRHL